MKVNFPMPNKCREIMNPWRYKVLRGGRGGSKSWTVARALLGLGMGKKLHFLCGREYQNSIKDSVHKLLEDQIAALNIGDFYDVLENEIRGVNGSTFIFHGLHEQSVDSIKSFEGIDIAWIEEGHVVTKKSLDILIPTIRRDGSEIWITFNPDLDTDEVWKRFVENTPPDCLSLELNFTDNPWFPDVLEKERQHCLLTDPESYENIWEGKCRPTVEGAIYAKETGLMLVEGRYAPCPYDPRLKVHTVWDMGWRGMAIGLIQRGLSECRIIAYFEGEGMTTDQWANEVLNPMKLNWGWDWLPHDAFYGSRRSTENDYQLLKRCGRKVKPQLEAVPTNIGVEDGIRAAKQLLKRTYLNKGGLGIDRLWECLRRYKRHIPKSTNEPTAPVHDEYSHGCDMIRYTALVVDRMVNDEEDVRPRIPTRTRIDDSVGALDLV